LETSTTVSLRERETIGCAVLTLNCTLSSAENISRRTAIGPAPPEWRKGERPRPDKSLATIHRMAVSATQSVAEVQQQGRRQLPEKSAVRPPRTGAATKQTTWPVPVGGRESGPPFLPRQAKCRPRFIPDRRREWRWNRSHSKRRSNYTDGYTLVKRRSQHHADPTTSTRHCSSTDGWIRRLIPPGHVIQRAAEQMCRLEMRAGAGQRPHVGA